MSWSDLRDWMPQLLLAAVGTLRITLFAFSSHSPAV